MGLVMDSKDIQRSLSRIAQEILEANDGAERLLLVGIHAGGVPIAQRLAKLIGEAEGEMPAVGEMDITLYRDDLYTGLEKPVLGETKLPTQLRGVHLVLVDDVLFTGRTVRAALDEVMDYGRPARIQLAVLIDRGHRELPIAANFVGRRLDTEMGDKVLVSAASSPDASDNVSIDKADKGLQ